MTINALVKELCKREGLKSQTSIANVRELVGHLSDMFFEEWVNVGQPNNYPEAACALTDNGRKRAARKSKAKVRK